MGTFQCAIRFGAGDGAGNPMEAVAAVMKWDCGENPWAGYMNWFKSIHDGAGDVGE